MIITQLMIIPLKGLDKQRRLLYPVVVNRKLIMH